MIFVGDFIPKKTIPKVPDFGNTFVVANLEGPVCQDELTPSDKVGVHLHSTPFELKGNWAFVLANNHIMDFGIDGLKQSKEFLVSKGWICAGAGDTITEARIPMFLKENNKTIAVISCCERQFGMAEEKCAGVATIGEWLYHEIIQSKKVADFVVVSCHCASEFSTAISPRLQSFYHSLIDVGADVIHGHHAHVPQGWEDYKGHPIFYGLGNFVIDSEDNKGNHNFLWSLIANVDFSGDKLIWSVNPYGEVPDNVEQYIELANLGFKHPELLNALWQKSCIELYHQIYAQNLRAPSVESYGLSVRDCLRKLYFIFQDFIRIIIKKEISTRKSLFYGRVLYNFFNCQSHVDVISTALGVLTGTITDERTKLDKIYYFN